MDNHITARCYRVSHPDDRVTDFHTVLFETSQLPHGRREVEIERGIRLRVESVQPDGDLLIGDFCRKQTRNIPSYAHDRGLAANEVPDGYGLGHVAAFVYHVPTRCLLLQSNRQSATPKRIALYVNYRSPGSIFNISPVVHPDTIARLRGKEMRSIRVRFSNVENLAALEREGISAARAAKEAADAYDANIIDVTFTAGLDRDARLNENASTAMLERLAGDNSVGSLKVKAVDDGRVETIDLIEDNLFFKGELEFPERDPGAHFEIRADWLRNQFDGVSDLLRRMFL